MLRDIPIKSEFRPGEFQRHQIEVREFMNTTREEEVDYVIAIPDPD